MKGNMRADETRERKVREFNSDDWTDEIVGRGRRKENKWEQMKEKNI